MGREELIELVRRRARNDLLTFMHWTWWGADAFQVGRHTEAICARLTRAAEDLRAGKGTRLVISVPFRHGKSEIAKAFCAFLLGNCADLQPSVIEACYNSDLAEDFSDQIRSIMQDEAYQAVFPGVKPARGKNTVKQWQIHKSQSRFRATGLVNGSATGRGASLIIVDDYLANYSASRSKTIKASILNAFKMDIFTRKAPTSIVLVIATQWSDDDLIGEIDKESKPGGTFEGFEFIRFPARKAGEYDYLFPERYPADWYDENRRTLGPRMAAALMDCSPRPDEGGRFKPGKQVQEHYSLDGWPQRQNARAWDLASSAKERDGDDPDWTWGVRGCVTGNKHEGWSLWILNAVRTRSEAPERDALIRNTARNDGAGVRQYVEQFGAYKDAVKTLKVALRGVTTVRGIRLTGDKTVKAAPLEPIFDAGRVHVYRGPGGMDDATYDAWVADFTAFPEGAHDDAVDATALLFHALNEGGNLGLLV